MAAKRRDVIMSLLGGSWSFCVDNITPTRKVREHVVRRRILQITPERNNLARGHLGKHMARIAIPPGEHLAEELEALHERRRARAPAERTDQSGYRNPEWPARHHRRYRTTTWSFLDTAYASALEGEAALPVSPCGRAVESGYRQLAGKNS